MLTTSEIAVDKVAARLKVLADPTRLRIFDLLMGGERCNCDMGEALGLAPNLISHHLSVLRTAGLVDARRDRDDGRWIHYAINRAALDDLAATLATYFDPARLEDRVTHCGPPGRAG